MSKAGVSMDRLLYILNSKTEDWNEAGKKPDMSGDIVFDHVSFAYEASKEVLKDISLTIKGGTTLGILGGTGSGKSTMMHLLNRLYDLSEGHIYINGVPVEEISLPWLRANTGMVLQEPYLFSRTIEENIAITAPADEAAIRHAASVACMDESIRHFSKGYQTIVGERGVTLSGGQKQRTAIARMLMQETPIMIFDDSLSAVDAETDEKIRHALREYMGKATVIIISHRISTLMEADSIIVMEHGEIVQQGTHEELIRQKGLYQEIYEIQRPESEWFKHMEKGEKKDDE
jgi:ATP-binding cassette subfamily B protein